MSEQELTPAQIGRLGPYGMRALSYVRDRCPRRFATITDPIEFFTSLASQMHEQVLAIEQDLAPPPAPGEDWAAALGRMNMAHLAAEEQVFSEMLYQAMPPEDSESDLSEDPDDPEYNRYLKFLDDLRQAPTDAREADRDPGDEMT